MVLLSSFGDAHKEGGNDEDGLGLKINKMLICAKTKTHLFTMLKAVESRR